MADFKPVQNQYNDMTPFKTWLKYQINTWGLNNFPFVESDFDDLTNYAMMMKLMKHFNILIENQNMVEEDMTNLYNAYTELQNYVNNFFDNLDVQDEVNNKLDEMVEDGSLDEILTRIFNDLFINYEEIEGINSSANSKMRNGSTIMYNYTFGQKNNAVVSSVIAGESNNIPDVESGTTQELSRYRSRDSVALYVKNSQKRYLDYVSSVNLTYTSTGVIFTPAYDISEYKVGMILDSGERSEYNDKWYVGVIKEINNQEIVLDDGWWLQTTGDNVSVQGTPPSTNNLYVNYTSKIWGINNNVFRQTGIQEAVAEEIGLFNSSTNSRDVNGIDIVNFRTAVDSAVKVRRDANSTGRVLKSFASYDSEIALYSENTQQNKIIQAFNTQSEDTTHPSFEVRGDGVLTYYHFKTVYRTTNTTLSADDTYCLTDKNGIVITLPTENLVNGRIIHIVGFNSGSTADKTFTITSNVAIYDQSQSGTSHTYKYNTYGAVTKSFIYYTGAWYCINNPVTPETQ